MPSNWDFFWGIVIGVLLTTFGSWLFAVFSSRMRKKEQKNLVASFCIDTISNLQSIIKDMDRTRDRGRLIHHDFLTLIDVEIGVYGRNREHLIHLPETARSKVREFMNDCAVKKAEVASKLAVFERVWSQADQIEAEGRLPEANRKRDQAQPPLEDAHKAADKLVIVSQTGTAIIDEVSKL